MPRRAMTSVARVEWLVRVIALVVVVLALRQSRSVGARLG